MRLLPTLLALAILSAPAAPLAGSELPKSVRWLREYIQIDTTNPPGGERPAAEYLAAILEREGLESELLESPEGRMSLYARWAAPGSGGRALVLLHHIDVVPAEEVWSEEPFSGRFKEGDVWGRGAIDAKGLGIAQLAALVSLRREGVELDRDVIFLAVADEELGGGQGAAWLLEAHPELFEGVEAVLNEGGANRAIGGRLVYWGLEVAQKRPLWLEVTTRGTGGHGSTLMPGSPTHRLILALARLVERPLEYRLSEPARMHLGGLAELEGERTQATFARLGEILAGEDPASELPPGWPAVLVDTVQVTEIQNGKGRNVIAPEAIAYVDIRLLPDTDAQAFLAGVVETLGERVGVELVLSSPPAPPSPVDTPFFKALETALAVRAPVLPVMISGTTDSRYFRERGIAAYGFSPFGIGAEEMRGIHTADESMPVDAFLRGIETLRRVLLACGRSGRE